MTEEILSFATPAELRKWHETHHARPEGFWLRLFKKGSGEKSVSYAEALDEALCHGWIDGQKKSFDADSWLQKFTPRRPRSGWSRVNTGHAERLIAAGRMSPAGLAQVDAAKADGRWAAAYDSPRNAVPPADFLAALEGEPKARAFFATLNRANIYAIVYRLQTAKRPETRNRRLTAIVEMLARGEKFH
ncbi:MAG TPA: YdeI/OmpD-associated family protein [Chthoniobacterales bacterium]